MGLGLGLKAPKSGLHLNTAWLFKSSVGLKFSVLEPITPWAKDFFFWRTFLKGQPL